MKLKSRDIKKVCTVVAALFLLVTVHVASVYLFAVHRFTVIADHRLSSTAVEHIEAFLSSTDEHTSLSMQALAQKLKQHFGFLETVSCCQRADGIVEVIVEQAAPFMLLNNGTMALTKHNRIVSPQVYAAIKKEKLAICNVPLLSNEQQLPHDAFAYLRAIEKEILPGSTIDWQHRHTISFHPAGHTIELICNQEIKPSSQLLDHCHHILSESNWQGLRADARFDQQIIISKLTSRR